MRIPSPSFALVDYRFGGGITYLARQTTPIAKAANFSTLLQTHCLSLFFPSGPLILIPHSYTSPPPSGRSECRPGLLHGL